MRRFLLITSAVYAAQMLAAGTIAYVREQREIDAARRQLAAMAEGIRLQIAARQVVTEQRHLAEQSRRWWRR